MPRRLVRSLCCASAVALLSWAAAASVAATPVATLSPQDLQNSQAVGQWLKAHGRSAPRDQAQRFNELGQKAQRAGRWGAATKSFGESALLYPTPEVLSAYGHALLHERAGTRTAATGTAEQQQDWQEVGRIYAAALAADDELRQLKPAQRQALAADAACLAQAAQGRPEPASCPALRLYQAALPGAKR